MTETEQIADGLSEIKQEWLLGSLVPNCEKETILALELEQSGLLDGRFDLTPLGIQVRAILEARSQS